MAFCSSYNLPKISAKIRTRSTYPKKLNSKTRLRNEKMLCTHSAKIESGRDQCTPFFMHEMNNMLHMCNKLNHTNLFMNVSSPLLKKFRSVFVSEKNIEFAL